MGFFKTASELRMKDPVEGTARVIDVGIHSRVPANNADPRGQLGFVRCKVRLVVSGPGIEPREVELTKTFRMAKMPGGGANVPITIDRADPERFAVQWDEAEGDSLGDVMTAMRGRQRARSSARAEQQALGRNPD